MPLISVEIPLILTYPFGCQPGHHDLIHIIAILYSETWRGKEAAMPPHQNMVKPSNKEVLL